MNYIDLKTKLTDLNIRKDEIKRIVNNNNLERMSNNPRLLNKESIKKILEGIY